jgi:hypothetical protein
LKLSTETQTKDDVLLERLEEETKAAASHKIMYLLLLCNFNQKHNLKKKTHTNKHRGIDNNSRQASRRLLADPKHQATKQSCKPEKE